MPARSSESSDTSPNRTSRPANAGPRDEGLHRHMNFTHGQWVNVIQLGMIRSDWVSEAKYRKGREFERDLR